MDEGLPSTVTFHNDRLCYSGQRCYKIPPALVKLYGTKAHSLDISYNEVATLKGLEGFCFLRELVLDNNQLTDSLVFPFMPYLHTLSLNKNQIIDIEQLVIKISQNLPALVFLSLLGNKACPNQLSSPENDDDDYQRYRYFVLHHLPSLEFLDSTKVNECERMEAARRGQFMKVVRPKQIMDEENSFNIPSIYSPLPKTLRQPNDHKGAYSKCRYRYSGKHSEGNRFIVNCDL